LWWNIELIIEVAPEEEIEGDLDVKNVATGKWVHSADPTIRQLHV
jgi:hypothetical protein